MANIETLKKRMEKERELEKKHKQNADKMQKEIESRMQQEIGRSVNKLNMTTEEYKKFMYMLDKKSRFIDAVNLVMEESEDDKDKTAKDREENSDNTDPDTGGHHGMSSDIQQ